MQRSVADGSAGSLQNHPRLRPLGGRPHHVSVLRLVAAFASTRPSSSRVTVRLSAAWVLLHFWSRFFRAESTQQSCWVRKAQETW